jgi:trigger factor
MKIQVETLSPVEKKVTVEIDPERVAKEFDRAYSALGRRVKIRGFRPGKVPRAVLERTFRDQVEGDVVQRLVSETFEQAVREEDIDAVAPPHVNVGEQSPDPSRPFAYSARVEVKPTIAAKDYRGLPVSRKPASVTDETVEAELARLRDSMAQLVAVEGRDEAALGDWAVIDYVGTVDGKTFEGGKAEGAVVEVKEGSFLAGEIAALAGRKVGETLEIEQVFPADFREEKLRGQAARFSVTLKGLRDRKVPALDDAMAKDVGVEGVGTLEALRARIRADLEKREKRREEAETHDQLLKGALAKNDFEVPPALVERAIDAMMESTAQRFARQGLDVRELDLDVARLRADLREHALLQVKGALLLEAIAEAEKIEVTDEDVKAEIERRAEEMGVPPAKLKLRPEAREGLKQRIREDKAVALLAAHANFT